MENIRLSRAEIKDKFEKEFSWHKDKFVIFDLPLDKTSTEQTYGVAAPGVYVFWKADQAIKVGRHLENSRKRALEHIRDDTGQQMKKLRDDKDAHLLLFNVKDKADIHWVAALEIFLEDKLKPLIKSKRTG